MAGRASTFRAVIVAGLLVAAASGAAPRAALVGGGDCRDPELLSHLRFLSAALKPRMADRLVDEDTVRERLRPQPQRAADELRRQLDAARMQYYQADFKRAEVAITAVRDDARKLSPGPDRFRLWADSELLLALLYRDTNRADLGDESFRRVLRVQSSFELDADLFSPSTRQRFDKLRKEVAAGARGKLELRTSPAGADVFVEGVKIGKTPFVGELPQGSYALGLVKGELSSLPRQIMLAGPMQLHVDLGFEGAIQPTRVTCLSDTGDEGVRLLNAVKLATLLDVEEVVVLRLDRPSSGPAWLAASLVNVQTAQKIREGGLKLTSTEPSAPEGLDELATFVMTGERTSRVQTPPSVTATPPPVVAEAAPLTANQSAVAVETASSSPPSNWRRPAAYGLGALGVVSAGAGVYFLSQAGAARSEMDTYRLPNGSIDPDRRFEAAAARDRADASQTASIVTFTVGAAAIGAAAWLYVTSAEDTSTAVAVMAGPDGAALTASVRF